MDAPGAEQGRAIIGIEHLSLLLGCRFNLNRVNQTSSSDRVRRKGAFEKNERCVAHFPRRQCFCVAGPRLVRRGPSNRRDYSSPQPDADRTLTSRKSWTWLTTRIQLPWRWWRLQFAPTPNSVRRIDLPHHGITLTSDYRIPSGMWQHGVPAGIA